MLYSIIVKFKAEADAVIPPTLGHHAYALFLGMLNRANAPVAQQIHDIDGPKPFTISPLQGRFRRHPGSLKLTEGEIYWIRFTFLQGDLFAHFLDAVMKAGNQTMQLDQAALRIDEVVTTPDKSPLCNCQTFEDILSQALPERQIHLRFLSPTAFRSAGRRNVLFPEPRLLVNSLLPRWQSFSPVKLDDSLTDLADRNLRIARYKLETRMLNFGSYQEAGFEGNCTLEMAERMPDEAAGSLNALADFAFYCGTGAKTTMGMGQTRRASWGSRTTKQGHSTLKTE